MGLGRRRVEPIAGHRLDEAVHGERAGLRPEQREAMEGAMASSRSSSSPRPSGNVAGVLASTSIGRTSGAKKASSSSKGRAAAHSLSAASIEICQVLATLVG